MYAESTGSRKTLGDVDVLYHDGLYHLFHLVLPNHDFIAHAVSNDCFNWRRVENSLFIGHPGAWDDSMLWTMHVSRHPTDPTLWRMFYTGLSRRDKGLKQRIGCAISKDLYAWEKCEVNWVDRRSPLPYDLPGRPSQPPFAFNPDSDLPIAPPSKYYESELDEGRHWISWRDPFYFEEDGRGLLLCAGRVKDGPIVRRGCVAVMEETQPDHFAARPPLHHPGLYDDVEVPCMIKIQQEYYLIGSIREDAKIRYWHTDKIGNPWQSYHDNVLLATGNYAGRITKDENGFLLWNFFTEGGTDRQRNNLMPPPKRLVREPSGLLRAKSFEGFDARVESEIRPRRLCPLKKVRDGDACVLGDDVLTLKAETGFQAYLFDDELSCFRFTARLRQRGFGKTGLVFRVNAQTHDGYYLSLDLTKGVAQLRAWGTGELGSGENMMQFKSLQSAYWDPCEGVVPQQAGDVMTDAQQRGAVKVQLLAYGSYLELSINDRVYLSLVDQTFPDSGGIGVYVESAEIEVMDSLLETLLPPVQSDEHLTMG